MTATWRKWERVSLIDVDEELHRLLVRRHPHVAGLKGMVIVASTPDVRFGMTAVLQRLAVAMNTGDNLDVDELVRSLCFVNDDGDSEAAFVLVEVARRESAFRRRVVMDFGALTAAEVADLAGSSATNRGQRAYRWRRHGRVFAVPYEGNLRYLGFQFDDSGEPLPVIRDILAALDGWPAWQTAAWFVTANGLLDHVQPVHLLAIEPGRVLDAAVADARRHESRMRASRQVGVAMG